MTDVLRHLLQLCEEGQGQTPRQQAAYDRILATVPEKTAFAVIDGLIEDRAGLPSFDELRKLLKGHRRESPANQNRAWFCAVSGDFGGDWNEVTREQKDFTLAWLKEHGPQKFAVNWTELVAMLGGSMSEPEAVTTA